jgi:hypothetical protein
VLPGSPEGLEVAGGKDEVMSVLFVGTLWPSPDRGPERGGGYWGGSLLGSLQGRPHLSPCQSWFSSLLHLVSTLHRDKEPSLLRTHHVSEPLPTAEEGCFAILKSNP